MPPLPLKEKNRKISLGQFYTSAEVAEFMIGLTTKSKSAKILEPGFGEGIFIEQLLNSGFSNITSYDIDKQNYQTVKGKFQNQVHIIHKDFLRTPQKEKFDLVIGNPPYVHWNKIPLEIREFLRTDRFWSQYSNGEWDLFYAFIVWSIEKLEDNGELIFIVPYDWFNSTFGASLRKYLIDNGQFEIICSFGEFKLFKDCFPNNIIFRYRKSQNKSPIWVSQFKGRKGNIKKLLDSIKKEIENKTFKKEDNDLRIFTAQNFSNENFWYLATPKEINYTHKIEKSTNGIVLRDFLDVGVGIVSGYDKAFFVEESQLGSFSKEEKNFIFPFIKAKNCKRYSIEGACRYIFVDRVTSEQTLKSHPGLFTKLYEHKNNLLQRHMSKNKNWWNWATVRNKEIFDKNLNKAKIFVPCIDRNPVSRYSLTHKKVFGSGDVLVIAAKENLREDLKYVLAWLNSKIIHTWYKTKGPHAGHRTKYTQVYVSQIPFRTINWGDPKEIRYYNQIVEKTTELVENGSDQNLEQEIDGIFEILVN